QKAAPVKDVSRIFISSLSGQVGKRIVIRGWIQRLRALAKTAFIVVQDCTGEAQCVAATEDLRGLHAKLDDAIEIDGVVRADGRAKAGVEIDIHQARILNPAASGLPFNSSSDVSAVSADIRLEYRPLSLRNAGIGRVFRLQAAILRYFREFL